MDKQIALKILGFKNHTWKGYFNNLVDYNVTRHPIAFAAGLQHKIVKETQLRQKQLIK